VVAGGAGLTYINPFLILLLALATWGFVRRRRGLLAAGLIGIFLFSWLPVSWLLAQPLEGWYSPHPPAASDAQAIVVLAGGAIRPEAAELPPALNEGSYLRCHYGLSIWKMNRQLPMLLCGGTVFRTSLALVMRDMMVDAGVPESQLWTEERSTSTYENAVYAAEILRRKGIRRIILVTEAHHMLRSERCFRKQGLDVLPAACNFALLHSDPSGYLPGGRGILMNEQTLHELVGLGWYLVTRRI